MNGAREHPCPSVPGHARQRHVRYPPVPGHFSASGASCPTALRHAVQIRCVSGSLLLLIQVRGDANWENAPGLGTIHLPYLFGV